MSASNRTIVAMLVVAGLAIAFWLLLLAPRREEASVLTGRADQLRASQAESRAQVAEALAAKREFPTDYRRLVVFGQAVPSGEETPSLLVDLSSIARRSKVKFEGIQLSSAGEGAAAAPPPVTTPAGAATAASAAASPSGAVPAAATVPPTEAAAALLPLGATVGTAGLGVMPYKLTFSGDFFQIADFIEGIDSLVHGSGENVDVKGRLITLDGFSLAEGQEGGSSKLDASFSVTTYLTPPDQGATAGADPSEPAPSSAVPASAESTEPAAESSTTVSNTG